MMYQQLFLEHVLQDTKACEQLALILPYLPPSLYTSSQFNILQAARVAHISTIYEMLIDAGANAADLLLYCHDIDKFKRILSHLSDNALNNNVIHRAIRLSLPPECFQLLVEHVDDINAYNREMYTPLHTAVIHNNIDALTVLLAKGADVNISHSTDYFTPPIYYAVTDNTNNECFRLLLAHNDITVPMKDGSVLMHCARVANIERCNMLRERSLRFDEMDARGFYVLTCLILSDNYMDVTGADTVKWMRALNAPVQETAVLKCIGQLYVRTLEALISAGPDIDMILTTLLCVDDTNTFHHLLQALTPIATSSNITADIERILISIIPRCSVTLLACIQADIVSGLHLLQQCIQQQQTENAEWLLMLCQPQHNIQSWLEKSIEYDDVALFQFLLLHKSEMMIYDVSEVLCKAMLSNNRLNFMESLLSIANVNVNVLLYQQPPISVLAYAVQQFDVQCIAILVQHGARIYWEGCNALRVFLETCERNLSSHFDILDLLLSVGDVDEVRVSNIAENISIDVFMQVISRLPTQRLQNVLRYLLQTQPELLHTMLETTNLMIITVPMVYELLETVGTCSTDAAAGVLQSILSYAKRLQLGDDEIFHKAIVLAQSNRRIFSVIIPTLPSKAIHGKIGAQLLVDAVKHDSIELTRVLLDYDAGVECAEKRREALDAAIFLRSTSTTTIVLLIERGIAVTTRHLRSLLHPVQQFRFDVSEVMYAIVKNCEIDLETRGQTVISVVECTYLAGRTPITLALHHGCVQLLKLLYDKYHPCTDEWLHELAMCRTHLRDMFQFLMDIGVPLNFKTRNGISAIHAAVLQNNLELAELLVRHGADVNMLTADGETVLSLSRSREMTELLCKHCNALPSLAVTPAVLRAFAVSSCIQCCAVAGNGTIISATDMSSVKPTSVIFHMENDCIEYVEQILRIASQTAPIFISPKIGTEIQVISYSNSTVTTKTLKLRAPVQATMNYSFSKTGDKLCTIVGGKTIMIWDTNLWDEICIALTNGVSPSCVAFDADDKQIAVVCAENRLIQFYSIDDGLVNTMPLHAPSHTSCCVVLSSVVLLGTPDGMIIIDREHSQESFVPLTFGCWHITVSSDQLYAVAVGRYRSTVIDLQKLYVQAMISHNPGCAVAADCSYLTVYEEGKVLCLELNSLMRQR